MSKIYVDFDDCLCDTARHFSLLAHKLFNIEVPYENIRYFDLQRSFSITDEEYEKMLKERMSKYEEYWTECIIVWVTN